MEGILQHYDMSTLPVAPSVELINDINLIERYILYFNSKANSTYQRQRKKETRGCAQRFVRFRSQFRCTNQVLN